MERVGGWFAFSCLVVFATATSGLTVASCTFNPPPAATGPGLAAHDATPDSGLPDREQAVDVGSDVGALSQDASEGDALVDAGVALDGDAASPADAVPLKPDAGAEDANLFGFPRRPSNVHPASAQTWNPKFAIGESRNCVLWATSSPYFSADCPASRPTLQVILQDDGKTPAVLVAVRALSIAPSSALTIMGSHPVIVLVDGEAAIRGAVRIDADHATSGAGARTTDVCMGSKGRMGATLEFSGGGGGGGGFATAGAKGGASGGEAFGGVAGDAVPNASVVPLLGGCPGGDGGEGVGATRGQGGGGGGALQISASGLLELSGNISAGGGGGTGGQQRTGGGGGGSGGALLFEGNKIRIDDVIRANGGGGGEGGSGITNFSGADGTNGDADVPWGGAGDVFTGGDGGRGGAADGPTNGGDGSPRIDGNGGGGGGGGGGGLGLVRIKAWEKCESVDLDDVYGRVVLECPN